MKYLFTSITLLFCIAVMSTTEVTPTIEIKKVSETSSSPKPSTNEEFEEYPFEDYIDYSYVETECQDCLISAEADGCLEEHVECLELPDCIDWLACVGWCDALEADDDCYDMCDSGFIDLRVVETDLRTCACDMCGMYCRTLCGVESF